MGKLEKVGCTVLRPRPCLGGRLPYLLTTSTRDICVGKVPYSAALQAGGTRHVLVPASTLCWASRLRASLSGKKKKVTSHSASSSKAPAEFGVIQQNRVIPLSDGIHILLHRQRALFDANAFKVVLLAALEIVRASLEAIAPDPAISSVIAMLVVSRGTSPVSAIN